MIKTFSSLSKKKKAVLFIIFFCGENIIFFVLSKKE
jgi:hypothetical protein